MLVMNPWKAALIFLMAAIVCIAWPPAFLLILVYAVGSDK